MSDFEIAKDGASTMVTLREKLTALVVQGMQPALKQAIADGSREVVFDLAATQTIDSTAIGLLVAASNSLAAVQGTVRVVNVGPEILKLFKVMKLTDRLHVQAGER